MGCVNVLVKSIVPELSAPITDYGRPVRKSPPLHTRKSTLTPKFLGTAKAYFVCLIGPILQTFFDLCLHWVSLFRRPDERSFRGYVDSAVIFISSNIVQKPKSSQS